MASELSRFIDEELGRTGQASPVAADERPPPSDTDALLKERRREALVRASPQPRNLPAARRDSPPTHPPPLLPHRQDCASQTRLPRGRADAPPRHVPPRAAHRTGVRAQAADTVQLSAVPAGNRLHRHPTADGRLHLWAEQRRRTRCDSGLGIQHPPTSPPPALPPSSSPLSSTSFATKVGCEPVVIQPM